MVLKLLFLETILQRRFSSVHAFSLCFAEDKTSRFSHPNTSEKHLIYLCTLTFNYVKDCNCSQKYFSCWGWHSSLCLRWWSGNKENFSLSCTTPGREWVSGKGHFVFCSAIFIVQSSSPLLLFLLVCFSFHLKKDESVQVKIMYSLSSTVFSSQKGLKRFHSPKGTLFHPYVKCLRSVLSGYIVLLRNNFTILIVQGKNYLNHVNQFQPCVMTWLLNFQLAKAVYSIH